MGLRKIGAQLQGHPDMHAHARASRSRPARSARASRCALGIALALRLDGLDDTAQVFGVLSDGDCQEGQTWEAATAAAHFGVPNLTAIVDYNHLQTDGTTEEVMDIGDVRAKFEAFGWDAVEIDGHDMAQVVEALERSRTLRKPGRDRLPRRKKGKGVSSMEGRFGFHGKPPHPRAGRARRWRSSRRSSTSRPRALQAATGEAIDAAPRPRPSRSRPATAYGDALARARRGARGRRRARRRPGRLHPVDQVRQAVPGAVLQRRRGRGEHDVDGLRPGGHRQGARTARPSRSSPPGAPTTRSASGIAHNELKVRIGASHGGVSLGEDGASHQMIEDIALMRAMPRMRSSSRPTTTRPTARRSSRYERESRCTCASAARRRRSSTSEIPETLGGGVDVAARGQGHLLIATAATWSGGRSRRPSRSSARTASRPRSLNVSIIKPLALRGRARVARARPGVAVTAEEHRVVGGLADAVRAGGGRAAPGADLRGRHGRRVRRLRHRRGRAWSTSA